jgi:hypothetical protein
VEKKEFLFHRALGPSTRQKDVFELEVRPVLQFALQGYPCTIFAYGQTGSGKTHTLEGAAGPIANFSNPSSSRLTQGAGIVPRVLQHLYRSAAHIKGKLNLTLMHLEVYKEKVLDLLDKYEVPAEQGCLAKPREDGCDIAQVTRGGSPTKEFIKQPLANRSSDTALSARRTNSRRLETHQTLVDALAASKAGPGPTCSLVTVPRQRQVKIHDTMSSTHGGLPISGARLITATDLRQALEIVEYSRTVRQTHGTLMNERSSRSHSLLSVRFSIEAPFLSTSQEGHINLVDLSGSENIKRSGAEDVRFDEASLINKGLLSLGRVMKALSSADEHVPYRDSKLTRLLRPSLSGEAVCLMVLAVSPSNVDADETVATMNYATLAKQILTRPTKRGSSQTEQFEQPERPRLSMGGESSRGQGNVAQSNSNVPIIPRAALDFTRAGFSARALLPGIRNSLELRSTGHLTAFSNEYGEHGARAIKACWQSDLQDAKHELLGNVSRSTLLSHPIAVVQSIPQHRGHSHAQRWVASNVLTQLSRAWTVQQEPIVPAMPITGLNHLAAYAIVSIFAAFDSSGIGRWSSGDVRRFQAHFDHFVLEQAAAKEVSRLAFSGGLHISSLQELLSQAVSACGKEASLNVDASLRASVLRDISAIEDSHDAGHFQSQLDFFIELASLDEKGSGLRLTMALRDERSVNGNVPRKSSNVHGNQRAGKASEAILLKLEKRAVKSVAAFASMPEPNWPTELIKGEEGGQTLLPAGHGVKHAQHHSAPQRSLGEGAWWQGTTQLDLLLDPSVSAVGQKLPGSPGTDSYNASSFWDRLCKSQAKRSQMPAAVYRRKTQLLQRAMVIGLHRRVRHAASEILPEMAKGAHRPSLRSDENVPFHRFAAYVLHMARQMPETCRLLLQCFCFKTQMDFEALPAAQVTKQGSLTNKSSSSGRRRLSHHRRVSSGTSAPITPTLNVGSGMAAAKHAHGVGSQAWQGLRNAVSQQDANYSRARKWAHTHLATPEQVSRYELEVWEHHCLSGPFMSSIGGAEAAIRANTPIPVPLLHLLGGPSERSSQAPNSNSVKEQSSSISGFSNGGYTTMPAKDMQTLAYIAAYERPLPWQGCHDRGPCTLAAWAIPGQGTRHKLQQESYRRLKALEPKAQ